MKQLLGLGDKSVNDKINIDNYIGVVYVDLFE